MTKTEILAGLDIGSTKVCTTVAELYGNGRLDIIGVGLTPCAGKSDSDYESDLLRVPV